MHQPKRVLALVSVAVILGVSGPFGTQDQMQILPRLLYWGVLCSATFWLGNFAAFCARQIHPAQQIAQFATATLFGAVIITAFILAINWLFLQVTVTSAVNLISLFCNSQAPQPPTGFFVSFDVSLLGHWAHEFSVVV